MTIDLFGQPITEIPKRIKGNPCLALYGQGPEGKTCKGCKHLYYQGGVGVAGSYLKCAMRKNTRGPGTDHKASWPACGKYEVERTETEPFAPGSFE